MNVEKRGPHGHKYRKKRLRRLLKSTMQGGVLLVVILVAVLGWRLLQTDHEKPTATSAENMETPEPTPLPPNPITYVLEEVEEPEAYVPPADMEYPYYIRVNVSQNSITIYGADEQGEYTIPVRAMICSVGREEGDTPLGVLPTTDQYQFHQMVDGTYAQYAYRLGSGHIMIHSVPYYTKDKSDLETDQFNRLGAPSSLGCVRVCVRDALWIMENCPPGTQVELYESTDPGPLGKPKMIKIRKNSPNAGWDPTDPDPANPWKDCHAEINGVKDVTVNVGEEFDPLEGVTATDTCGNNITTRIRLGGTYDCNTPGGYELVYYVEDALGSVAMETIRITVLDKE